MAKRRFIRRKPVQLGAPLPKCAHAALLCIDAAHTSGWALYLSGRLHAYGEITADEPAQRKRVCVEAFTSAKVRDLPLALALEVPFGGYFCAALALNATVALWRDTWRTLGLPPSRVLELTASHWRRPLFGRRPLARNAVRELEARLALRTACQDGCYRPSYALGPDAAAAICMGIPLVRSSLLAETVADFR